MLVSLDVGPHWVCLAQVPKICLLDRDATSLAQLFTKCCTQLDSITNKIGRTFLIEHLFKTS